MNLSFGVGHPCAGLVQGHPMDTELDWNMWSMSVVSAPLTLKLFLCLLVVGHIVKQGDTVASGPLARKGG